MNITKDILEGLKENMKGRLQTTIEQNEQEENISKSKILYAEEKIWEEAIKIIENTIINLDTNYTELTVYKKEEILDDEEVILFKDIKDFIIAE